MFDVEEHGHGRPQMDVCRLRSVDRSGFRTYTSRVELPIDGSMETRAGELVENKWRLHRRGVKYGSTLPAVGICLVWMVFRVDTSRWLDEHPVAGSELADGTGELAPAALEFGLAS
jgi:hypothetical protein